MISAHSYDVRALVLGRRVRLIPRTATNMHTAKATSSCCPPATGMRKPSDPLGSSTWSDRRNASMSTGVESRTQ